MTPDGPVNPLASNGMTTDVPPASLLLTYFETDVNNPVCHSNPMDPACNQSITGTMTEIPSASLLIR